MTFVEVGAWVSRYKRQTAIEVGEAPFGECQADLILEGANQGFTSYIATDPK